MLLILDLVHVVHGARVSAARHSVLANCRQNHTLSQALLKPTRLAPVSLLLCNNAVVFRYASINALVLHRSLKETLATLASYNAIVQTRCFIFANHTNLGLRIVRIHGHLNICCRPILLLLLLLVGNVRSTGQVLLQLVCLVNLLIEGGRLLLLIVVVGARVGCLLILIVLVCYCCCGRRRCCNICRCNQLLESVAIGRLLAIVQAKLGRVRGCYAQLKLLLQSRAGHCCDKWRVSVALTVGVGA